MHKRVKSFLRRLHYLTVTSNQQFARFVKLKRFVKTPRGPKKKRGALIIDRKHRHLSTARLLKAHVTQ